MSKLDDLEREWVVAYKNRAQKARKLRLEKSKEMKTANISVDLIDYMGSDLSVVNAARVSFNKESDWEWKEYKESGVTVEVEPFLSDKDAKLINYLAKHKHFSPFNHAFLSFRVKAPIFVARQLVKHKFLPWNEVSRRYVDDEPEFYLPGNGKWRNKADNVKQGSAEEGAKLIPIHPEHEDLWGDLDNQFDPDLHVSHTVHNCLTMYRELILAGVCAEQARMVLPQNTMTEWVWSGTLGAFLDMLVLRLDNHTQKETRDVAIQIAIQLNNLFPVSYKARIE